VRSRKIRSPDDEREVLILNEETAMASPKLNRIVLLVRDVPGALNFFKAAGLLAAPPREVRVTSGSAVVTNGGAPGSPSLTLVQDCSADNASQASDALSAVLSFSVAPGSLAALVPNLITAGGASLEGRIEYRPEGAVATLSTPAIPRTWIAFEEPPE
jgi:hypothetical protein